MEHPRQVPSGYLIADVFLEMHRRCGGCLYEDEARAMHEARHVKRMIAHLRYVARSHAAGRDPQAHALKRLCRRGDGSPMAADSSMQA